MDQAQLSMVTEQLLQVTERLYQEDFASAYSELVVLLPQLEGVIAQFEEEKQKDMAEKLGSALEAMESGDNTLLADILQYEVLEQLKG